MSNNFDVENYVSVSDRIKEFWKKHPEGRIVTEVIRLDDANIVGRMIVIQAMVYRTNEVNEKVAATGIAKEREGTVGANKTSFVENAETSAIGRALANMGFLIEKARPSQEEMESVERRNEEHLKTLKELKALAKDKNLKQQIHDVWEKATQDPTFAIQLLHDLDNVKNSS